ALYRYEAGLEKCRGREWLHKMPPAQGRKEVIQRQLVGHVDGGKRETPFVMISFEQVVVAHRNIKQVPRGDARRIMVVIFSPGGRYLHQIRTVQRRSACGEGCGERRVLAPAEQSRLELLIRRKPGQVHRSRRVRCEGHRARYHAAVIPPVETEPGPRLPRLVLQVSGLVKLFVVINAERQSALSDAGSYGTSLRPDEPRGDTR